MYYTVVVAGIDGRFGLTGEEVRDGVGVISSSSSTILWDAPEEDDVVE